MVNFPAYVHLSQNIKKIKLIFAVFLLVLLGACASAPQSSSSEEPEMEKPVDRFEGFNRTVFSFNDTIDRWLLKPVAKGYDWILPDPVQASVGNFFDNIGEVPSIINSSLQWKWERAAHDTGRLLVNSTVGVLGLFDVASKTGLDKKDPESFNQTLAEWGVPRGSYLVLPFLGPSTVRGTGALPAEWVTNPIQYLASSNAQLGANVVTIVHDRAELLDAEDLISGDRYLFIREAYLQRLDYLENDGQVSDDFGDDDFGDDDDYDFE